MPFMWAEAMKPALKFRRGEPLYTASLVIAAAMTENDTIPLPGLRLPSNLPWRVRFTAAVNAELRRLRTTGHYVPPRFFGYYFRNGRPIGVSGSWTVVLETLPPVGTLAAAVERATEGQYSISAGNGPADEPDYILVHDRRDGECLLWRFARLHAAARHGIIFVAVLKAMEEQYAIAVKDEC